MTSDESDSDNLDTNIVDDYFVPRSPPRPVTIEEDDNEEGFTYPSTNTDRFVEPYPGNAGKGIRKSKTRFEKWQEIQQDEGKKPWEPFASKDEWELAGWLLKNVGQKSTDEYLKLQIVREVDASLERKKILIGFY
jgi:hypothetical protein